MTKTSLAVRETILTKLRRDLIGPNPTSEDADLAEEILPEEPSKWYLTGWIAPTQDGTSPLDEDDVDAPAEETLAGLEAPSTAPDDEGTAQDHTARKRFLPTSLGLSTALPISATEVTVTLDWGDYIAEPMPPEAILMAEGRTAMPDVRWCRRPRHLEYKLALKEGKWEVALDGSKTLINRPGWLHLSMICRKTRMRQAEGPDVEIWSLSVFVVNRRAVVRNRRFAEMSYAFQVRMTVECGLGIVAGYDLTGYRSADPDLRTHDLHYHDVPQYAAGRNTACAHEADADGVVRRVRTEPMPVAEVERVAPNESITGVTFDMIALRDAARSGADPLRDALADLPRHYGDWIAAQSPLADQFAGEPRRREMAQDLIKAQRDTMARMQAGIDLLLTNDMARTAFVAMNEAVETAGRRRFASERGVPLDQIGPLKWRPFQLAFILVNLSGLTDKTHPDREIVDLLFFPTGGGKTEAYLGLAAYTIALRRLGASGVLGAGVTVIMRYTLRLLTLDQLGRAAGVICALELMRCSDAWKDAQGKRMLGDWDIEIGLWIGSAASPNKLGGKGDTGDDRAVTRVRAYRKRSGPAPAPIRNCPWCGSNLGHTSFKCWPNEQMPTRMLIVCPNVDCDFTGDRALPILATDDEIYRRLPAFIVATIDKFAALPWVGQTGAFFGHVDRADNQGFYGASEPRSGARLNNGWQLDPPDLIVQDELHLISGPLGTMAGLYETAIDYLATRTKGDKRIRPKIVASTATVRRAQTQIQALFDRNQTAIFPPPGISRRNSFFAETLHASEANPARKYIGLAALGRGPKLVFLRALVALEAAAQSEFEGQGATTGNAADPYMTAMCYFNALRELGGARRIVEDEVRDRAQRYGAERRRISPADIPFANRKIAAPVELTSRESTDQVAQSKRRLDSKAGSKDAVDVALATNMISVGLDITRLGLMVVMGQPKATAEYIQATSRVGRDHQRPGLVLSLLNVHKPRDRAHYERFGYFHESFYRGVEATSVTPWADRALDRALAAVLVAIIRHADRQYGGDEAAGVFSLPQPVFDRALAYIVERAAPFTEVSTDLETQITLLADIWAKTAASQTGNGGRLSYNRRGQNSLLQDVLDPQTKTLDQERQFFTAGRSMRDVEPVVRLDICGPNARPLQS